MDRPRIIILGGGFGGAYCAQALEKRLRAHDAEVILMDRHNFFVFYPLLIEAGTGNLEPRHAVVSIRSFLKSAQFRMGRVESIDCAARRIVYGLPHRDEQQEISFDHLVLALGSVTRMPDIPGLREYGFEMKSLPDAVALRDRAIALLETADGIDDPQQRRALLHFVVVGASFTGAEVAGEFDVLLRDARRAYRNVRAEDCHVTLLEYGPRILPALDEGLSAYATEHMRRRNIDVRLQTTVTAVEANSVKLNTGEQLSTRTLIWCAGIEPPPLLKSVDVPKDARGFILCERDLRVKGFDNVWAIGDCAVNPDPQGKPYPATAQLAIKQGVHLAKNLSLVLAGRKPEPCDIKDQGAIAALGCRTGVARLFGFKLAGFPAWLLWRTVYLMKMPGVFRKVRVAIDWTMDLFFKREYVQLSAHKRGE